MSQNNYPRLASKGADSVTFSASPLGNNKMLLKTDIPVQLRTCDPGSQS
jgi:hypothetical protein